MLLILYNLLSHIYHAFWLVILFEYLIYFILLVFWFQNNDLISAIHSYLKYFYENEFLVHQPLFILEMKVIFCNPHHGSQLITTHSILCYFFMCLFFHPFQWKYQWNNHLFTSGFQSLSREYIYKGGFYDQHMGFSVVIWSLMVVDENKDDVMLQLTQRRRNVMIMDKCWLLMLVVA